MHRWFGDIERIDNNNLLTKTNRLSLFSCHRYDREEPKYNYEKPGFSPETGHFTQVSSHKRNSVA